VGVQASRCIAVARRMPPEPIANGATSRGNSWRLINSSENIPGRTLARKGVQLALVSAKLALAFARSVG
jgi:hypothetical protein